MYEVQIAHFAKPKLYFKDLILLHYFRKRKPYFLEKCKLHFSEINTLFMCFASVRW